MSGLEPPTSRLSGGCSNQLSYKPVDLPAVSDSGGDDGIRTHDPLLAGQVLSQLSYTPVRGGGLGDRSRMRNPRSRPEGVLRTPRGQNRVLSRRERKPFWQTASDADPLISPRRCTSRGRIRIFSKAIAFFPSRDPLQDPGRVSAPTYLPVLLPAKYFRLSGA